MNRSVEDKCISWPLETDKSACLLTGGTQEMGKIIDHGTNNNKISITASGLCQPTFFAGVHISVFILHSSLGQ